MKAQKLAIGSQVVIPAGTKVTSLGETTKRDRDSIVTIRDITFTKAGNPKVTWKSQGYKASAILKV